MPELGDLGYEKESNIDTVPTAIVAVAVRDKPSPRRRRMAWPKRRRSEIDDGDATYPEKRSRMPRISAEEHIDDEMGIIAQGMESATHASESDNKGRPRGRIRPRASDASESTSRSLLSLGRCLKIFENLPRKCASQWISASGFVWEVYMLLI